ncbi:MAG: transcriptional regulator NrdR [Patescibacteria group bacterium]
MYCPVCKSTETKVVDSRLSSEGFSIRRRRECLKCNYRFSTVEEIELLDIFVIKKDGKKEVYNRKKVESGILKSLSKRPYKQEDFDRMIYSIERDIQKTNKKEIESNEIGEIIMKHLKKFDKVSYIRFASIYRDFTDVDNFKKEVSSLI